MNAALRTIDAGCAGMKEGLVLKEVQVPPSQLVGVVGLAGNPAKRTGKDAATRKIEMDIQTSGHLVEGATVNHPWRCQPQGYLKQFLFVHAHAIITQKLKSQGARAFLEWGFAPNPRIYRFRPEWPLTSPRIAGCLPYNRIAWQEDRATQGCDPSAEPGPEWKAAPKPPPLNSHQTYSSPSLTHPKQRGSTFYP